MLRIDASSYRSEEASVPLGPGEQLRLMVLAMMVLSGAVVIVDVLYNVFALAAIGLFVLGGLRIDRANMPLIFALVAYNIGGLSALQPYLAFSYSVEFVIGTAFVAITAIFFALMLNENAERRLNVVKWASIVGGLIAAGAGTAGYFDLGGSESLFTLNGRASGTFRDPNVLGPFLVLPLLFLIHDILAGRPGLPWRLTLSAIMALGLLLTFSRGAWAGFAVGLATLMGLMFLTSPSPRLRGRIVVLGLTLIGLLVLLIAAAFTVDGVGDLLRDRATLQKDYDSGPSGRFGNQWRAIPDLLERPFGFGPNRFWLYFPENPHNTYVNAFSSYGWFGGLAFLAFIAATIAAGAGAAFRPSPVRPYALVVFAALVPHLLQNLQIDTDRWRHLFMLYGLTWGLAALSWRWQDHQDPPARADQAARPPRLIRLS